jgi:proteasome accessory factor C
MPPERTTDRLRRILVLVPWVIANPGARVEEVCERFDMRAEELAADFEMLFMCGLPPFGPGDLIEAFIEDGTVEIRMADFLERPPRLTRAEALALLVTGRALTKLQGFEDVGSLRSALDKLAAAVAPGEAEAALDTADRIAVEMGAPGDDMLAVLRSAIAEQRRIHITYYAHSRDELTDRVVDPLLLFSANGYWYVVGLDEVAGEERTFRADRIRDITVSDVTFTPPAGFLAARYTSGPVFTPSPRDIEVTLSLGPEAAWMRETIPSVSEREEGGRIELRLRTPHTAWLVQLVLSAGPDAQVVSPPEVAAQVRDAAARALGNYAV